MKNFQGTWSQKKWWGSSYEILRGFIGDIDLAGPRRGKPGGIDPHAMEMPSPMELSFAGYRRPGQMAEWVS